MGPHLQSVPFWGLLQAGVLVGSVGAGAELADGSYIAGMHGRTTGIEDEDPFAWKP